MSMSKVGHIYGGQEELDGISGMTQAPGLLKEILTLVPLLTFPNLASFLCVYIV